MERSRIRLPGFRLPALSVCVLALAACGSVYSSTTHASVVGDGFRLVLPIGWTSGSPLDQQGFTTVGLYGAVGQLQVTVATLQIPHDPTNAQETAILDGNLEIVAEAINRTEDVQPTLTEPAHPVSFAGESCARVGLSAGSGEDSRIITCRRNQVIYDISVSGTATDQQMVSTLGTIATGWSWT
jgi:hypothetical protein